VIDFSAIAAAALDNAEHLLRELFPQGRLQGREFCVGNINGDAGDSLKVNLDTGKWSDFASGEKGGSDLISLWARARGIKQGEAARAIEAWLELDSGTNGHQRANANGNGRASEPKLEKRNVQPVHRYEIRDVGSKVLAVHAREDFERLDLETGEWIADKAMWWEMPNGGRGLGGISLAKLPLFGAERFRKLTAALDMRIAVLVEGEKKCDVGLWQRGINAAFGTVTGSGGTPSDESLSILLAFEIVVLWPDADDVGRAHMAAIGKALRRLGHKNVRIIDWPDAPPKGDAADFKGSDDELHALIAAALPFDESERSGRANQPDEKWKAPRVAAEIDRDDRFAQDDGGKLYWFKDGAYRPQGEEHIRQRTRKIVPPSQWSVHLANETIEYIRVASPRLWERPPLEVLNVRNGLLDLKTRDLRAHSPEHLSTVQLPVAYDPDATCPAWLKQVEETFPADAVLAGVAWQIVAWLMLPITWIHKALLLLGAGGTGKSTLLTALMAFLGCRNVSNLTLQKIENDRFGTARLIGKLANICADLPGTRLETSSTFKMIVGGDRLPAEYKFRDSFDFQPFTRLVFSANQPPPSKDASDAYFERWYVMPFNDVFRGTEKQVSRQQLDAALSAPEELSGVLNLALDYLPDVFDRGLTVTQSMADAHEEFQKMTDPLAIFLNKNTFESPDALVATDELRANYSKAATADGAPAMTETAFGAALKKLRPKIEHRQRTYKGKINTWCYVGIGLKAAKDQQQAQFDEKEDHRYSG